MRFAASLALWLTCFAACSGVSQLDPTSFGRGSWQRPDDVVAALEIDAGDRVADLGAGEGYFLPYLREAVGPDGLVYAVEVDPDKIRALEDESRGADNLEVVAGELDDPKLPEGELHLVLVVNTYHHIEGRERYFARLRRALAPDAVVAIIEPDEELRGVLSLFLDDDHASRASDVRQEMVAAGYRLAHSYDFLPVQIFEVFAPAGDPSDEPARSGPVE